MSGLEHRYFVYKARACGCRSVGECFHLTGMVAGERIEDCFVLRPDRDFAALVALRAYAATTTNKALQRDLVAWADRVEAEGTVREKEAREKLRDRPTIAECGKTNHIEVEGTGFCACGHAMFG